jgi:outer membrane biosynthesis protein TonB
MNTTAEFMIGRSADDAAERKQELRKIGWALLAALILHVVIGTLMAAFSGMFSRSEPLDDKPVELTIMDTPAPDVALQKPKNPEFRVTDPANESVEKPKDATIQSNANSLAASELPATGAADAPSQNGGNRPEADLKTQAVTLAQEGAQPQPSVRPEEKPSPSVAPSAAPTPTPSDALAMYKPSPTPAARPTATPQQQRSVYHPMTQAKRMTGAISNRGAASFNTVGTPLGKYQKLLSDAVGSRWYRYVQQQADLVSIGTAHLVFSVDRSGRVRNVRVVENSNNESFANVCLRSVIEVQLPPIPEDVADTLPSEGLEAEMVFTMYAN